MNWNSKQKGKGGRNNEKAADTVTYLHADPKLRGFGAASLVFDDGQPITNYSSNPRYRRLIILTTAILMQFNYRYRLACGKGIKNVHVWQFQPFFAASFRPQDLPDVGQRLGNGSSQHPFPCAMGSWQCMYDVATNGNTITVLAFRKGASELLTKSTGNCLRIWDLRAFDTSTPTTNNSDVVDSVRSRPAYVDVANSQHTKCLTAGFAFGGTYEFVVVRMDAPKEANSDAIAMPEKQNEEQDSYNNGLRRRR